MNGRAITPRQLVCLRYIGESIRLRGYAPSWREVQRHMNIRSTNGIHDHLMWLEAKGLVFMSHAKLSRSVIITEAGWATLGVKPGHCPHCGNEKQSTAGAA